ncbi:hypothetical protein BDW67DRAFT_132482 [Aspergillus spinulosporus]
MSRAIIYRESLSEAKLNLETGLELLHIFVNLLRYLCKGRCKVSRFVQVLVKYSSTCHISEFNAIVSGSARCLFAMRRPLVVFYFQETRIWALTPILSDSAETSIQSPFLPLERRARSVSCLLGVGFFQSNDSGTRKHSCHSWVPAIQVLLGIVRRAI